MENILYQNALFFKEKILPYTFILEGKDNILIIKSEKHHFAHLVGKQYSKNIHIEKLEDKVFFEKSLSKEIKYEDLLNFDNFYAKEKQWIQNKNEIFIDIFQSFVENIYLKLYKKKQQRNI